MANFNEYFPTLLIFEGGFVDDKNDHGGATNLGVTLEEWVKNGYDKDNDGDIDVNDLKQITKQDAAKIAKLLYWDRVRGDEIVSQSVAEFITDWAYNSGVGRAVKKTQALIGVTQDGNIGLRTLTAINAAQPKQLFDLLKASREAFYRAIVKNDSTQSVFLKGWLNRINQFKFKS